MEICCIGDEETARGFRLAGVYSYTAGTAAETAKALEQAAGRPDCGVIIITKAAADLVRGQVEELMLERPGPLIAEIAGPPARGEGRWKP